MSGRPAQTVADTDRADTDRADTGTTGERGLGGPGGAEEDGRLGGPGGSGSHRRPGGSDGLTENGESDGPGGLGEGGGGLGEAGGYAGPGGPGQDGGLGRRGDPPGRGGGDGVQGIGAPDDERVARAALTRIGEPGDTLIGRWLEEYGPVESLHALQSNQPPTGVSEQRWAGLRLRVRGVRPEADLAAIAALGGRFLCPGDAEWPAQLDDLGRARPVGLWVRGRPSLRYWALRSVAVVGARACTSYGAHVATVLGAGLAERGWLVVSGAAYGVDGAAHRGALAAGGATIAVLACGVDVPYPSGHRELIARVAEQGLVVAELPPGERPTRSRFVLRNRIIAALTRGTVVVEANLRSGALVTARRARDLGRYTMGVPGPVTSGLSAGVHELLRGEGVLVTDAAEVVELVGSMGELAPERRGPVVPRDLLSTDAARVLDALPARGAVGAAWIAQAAGTASDLTLACLHELLSLGHVERMNGQWRLTRP